jgi:uncharacterized protein (TIGR02231 family)
MRISILLFVILAAITPGARGAEAASEEAAPVSSKISEVTVYADRARVTRTATVGLRSGLGRVAFPKLPGWIDEGSVRVSLSPAGAGELVDVQIEKTFLARPDNEEIRKAEAAVTEVGDQLGALDDEAAALEAQLKQTDAIRAFSLEKLPKDTAAREVKIEEYSGVVKFIGASMLEISKAKRELDKRRRDLQPELRARQQKLADLRARAQLEQRTVVVAIKSAQAAQASLTLTYLLPGTTWEPVHEMRAAPDTASVNLASYAVVSQTSGEDWENAALTFSTQRPNATAKIPELEALLVGGGRSLAQVANPNGDSFQTAVANFEVQNPVWNYNNNRDRLDVQQAWAGNVLSQKQRQAKVVEVFQKVQQRGTTAQFPALGPQTVRSDGRTVRVPIGTARFAATPRIIAAPELSLNAVQTAELANTCGQPLLPGKVLLFAEGAFVGTTETEFVAPGENFALFMGVADRLKLARTLDQKRSSVTWTGKRKRMLASFLVSAENLSEKPVPFQLADRIPVSETDEIRVIGVKLQPEIKPDVKGLLKWEVTLPAKEKREFRIEYTLDYPAELPKPTSVSSSAAPSLKASEPAAPAERLYRTIGDLEQQIKK